LTLSKPQVLTLGTFPDATMAELERRFSVHHFPRIGHAVDGLDAATARQIVALGSEANQGINRALLAMLPKLEVVALFGVGTDLVDRGALKERSIPLSNTPGLVAVEVADLAIGLMIASARQIIYADRFIREGRWPQAQISLGRSVGKKTMGVVGLGAIGRRSATVVRRSTCGCFITVRGESSTYPTNTWPMWSNWPGKATSLWSPARADPIPAT
jgi:Lactate dehydrogenase and related dehydrogenases